MTPIEAIKRQLDGWVDPGDFTNEQASQDILGALAAAGYAVVPEAQLQKAVKVYDAQQVRIAAMRAALKLTHEGLFKVMHHDIDADHPGIPFALEQADRALATDAGEAAADVLAAAEALVAGFPELSLSKKANRLRDAVRAYRAKQ